MLLIRYIFQGLSLYFQDSIIITIIHSIAGAAKHKKILN